MKYGTGINAPKATKSSDGTGERSGSTKIGVAMGKKDATVGGTCTFNSGRTAGTCYTHQKKGY